MNKMEEDLVKATVRGFSRIAILWLLSRKPMSGYNISKELKRLTGWNFHAGVVYPLLYELEEKKLLDGKWVQKGRRRIKYYSTTKDGVEILNRIRSLFETPLREILKDLMSQI